MIGSQRVLRLSLIPFLVLWNCTGRPVQRNGDSPHDSRSVIAQEVYRAVLKPVQTGPDSDAMRGEAVFILTGDSIYASVNAIGVHPGVHTLQYHVDSIGMDVSCPDGQADRDRDGSISIEELKRTVGTLTISLTDFQPGNGNGGGSYPEANEEGTLIYNATISLPALNDRMNSSFGMRTVPANGVIVVCGAGPDSRMPQSAGAALPVLCGAVERVR